jgi:hypothetical protein
MLYLGLRGYLTKYDCSVSRRPPQASQIAADMFLFLASLVERGYCEWANNQAILSEELMHSVLESHRLY